MGTCVLPFTVNSVGGAPLTAAQVMGVCGASGCQVLKVNASPPSDITTCSHVLVSGAEFASMQASPWNLTESQGALVGGAILGVWAVGWAFRSLIRFLSQSDLEGQA